MKLKPVLYLLFFVVGVSVFVFVNTDAVDSVSPSDVVRINEMEKGLQAEIPENIVVATEKAEIKKEVPREDDLGRVAIPDYQVEEGGASDVYDDSVVDDYHDVDEKSELFTILDEAHDQPPTNLDFSTHGKAITLSESFLKQLEVGQSVDVLLDTERSLLVEDVSIRKSGSVKINFSIPNETSIYRGFITVGKTATFGRIVTPDGAYELEVVDGKGWLVDTRDIDNKNSEGVEDFLIPNS
jgi:hypothetical protein